MTDGPKKALTRRQTLQLSSSILALGAGLGVALRPSSAGAVEASQLQLKFFKVVGKSSTLMQTYEVPTELATQLEAGAVRQLQIKWYRSDTGKTTELLGGYKLPETLQHKIEKKR